MNPSVTLIITSYNWPRALDLVLLSVSTQSCPPDQIIIADDGSCDQTNALIKKWSEDLPIIHSWQSDQGFRASRSRNLAIMRAESDYVIFVDGDCLLPSNFIKNHKKLACRGRLVSGGRSLLSKASTDLLFDSVFVQDSDAFRGHKFFELPLGLLRDLLQYRWKMVRTCNLGVWKSDLISVSGFDEAYVGWGGEDSDLVIRLLNYGLHVRIGRYAACVCHLHHSENDRSSASSNFSRLIQGTLISNNFYPSKSCLEM